MEKLIKLILQLHPEFKEEIEGCSENEIRILKNLSPLGKMPLDYQTFLKYMGKKSGRVIGVRRKWNNLEEYEDLQNPRMRVVIDYSNLLKFYKWIRKKNLERYFKSLFLEHEKDPANFFLFGIDRLGNDNGHFYFDLSDPNLPVVEISETLEYKLHSKSFRAFLFEIPFKRTLNKYEYSKQWL